MTIITPVTESLPYSNEILEKSSIPFSCTITPYASQQSSSSSSSSINNSSINNKKLLRLSSIAKCNNCGSLLNPLSPMLDYPSRNIYGAFLCGLCGYEVTLHPDLQCNLQEDDDDNNENDDVRSMSNAYYIQRYENIVHGISYMNNRDYSSHSNYNLYSSRSNTNKMKNNNNDARLKEILPECYESLMEYAIDNNDDDDDDNNDEDILAEECPLLLIIVIMYSSRYNTPTLFYKYICECIQEILSNAPKHVRIGIFIACPNGRMTVMDLSSVIPHWKHVFINTNDDGNGDGDDDDDDCALKYTGLEYNQIFWFINNNTKTSKNHIEAVLRALGDSLVIHGTCSSSSNTNDDTIDNNNDNRVEIGSNIEAILDYIDYTGGYHPGTDNENMMNERNWKYSGGKIFIFCNEAPKEIPYLETYGDIGTGGTNGSCSTIGSKRNNNNTTHSNNNIDRYSQIQRNNIMSSLYSQEDELHQIFTSALLDTNSSTSLVDYFTTIGYRSCVMGLGIDIFGLINVTSTSTSTNNITATSPTDPNNLDIKIVIGLPLLRILSERSGCGSSGPILIQLPINDYNAQQQIDGSNADCDGGTLSSLIKEVICRCPWNNHTCFGAMLRIRTSQSFGIRKDDNNIDQGDEQGQQQEPSFYKKGGMIGPGSASLNDPTNIDNSWNFGTCDEHTTLSFDFEILSNNGIISDVAFTESHGDVELPTCMQTSFVYTAIIPRKKKMKEDEKGEEEDDDIEWIVVRRLRVYTKKFNIARDTESFIMSLNPEVMAMTLFHKLYSMSLTLGFDQTQILAKDWLLSLLLSTYQSALQYFSIHQSTSKNTIQQQQQHSIFSPSDRLLHMHQQGELSPRDILLGKGHPKLHNIPFVVYSLLLCDALHPLSYKSIYYYPTIDARCAAASNMHSMTPGNFFKCIVPKISLYAVNTNTTNAASISGENNGNTTLKMQCIMEDLPLSKELIQKAIEDQQRFCVDNDEHLFLLLDSAKQIICYQYSFSSSSSSSKVEDKSSNIVANDNNTALAQESATEAKTIDNNTTTSSNNPSLSSSSNDNNILYHPVLTELLESKMKQYKYPPPIHRIKSSSMFSSPDNDGTSKTENNIIMKETDCDQVSYRLLDAFIEDMELDSGGSNDTNHPNNSLYTQQQGNDSYDSNNIQNFQHWCDLFAEMVHEEIKAAQLGI